VLRYPPHCTHVLQGLDVVCFAKMKTQFRKEIEAFKDLHLRNVSKKDFAGVFGRAYLQAFTSETIKAAFSATGLYPFNPNAIKEKQTKPSLPTSTESSFPLPQPSPVQAIISAMGARPPTALKLSPSHFESISRSPVTLTRHPRNPNVNPSLDPETPSKRLHLMYGVTFLTPFSTSPMTDTAVDSLPTLFLAYCTLRDSDNRISIDDRITPWPSASDPTPLYSPY